MKTRRSSAFLAVLLLLLLLLSSSLLAAAKKEKVRCHSDDKAALLAVKAALGNPYHFASWMPDTPCCDWYDVDCDPFTARVVGLSVFQDANLTGTIPDAVAGLTHLTELMFHHLPGISGTIPPAIAKLSNLSLLIISSTSVSGPVPSFLGALTKLSQLDLSFNSLSGSIPASLAALPNLNSIDISRNNLTGTLPPLLFSKLSPSQQPAYLRLSHNNITGSIPTQFAAVSFAQVDLSRNAFTGDASPLFGAAKPLQQLDLSRNVFSFNLSGVALPGQLDAMDVSHNVIYGGIPAQVANLQLFNVSYNRLCGQVPAVARFDAYSYLHNKCLCGTPLPPCNKQ